VARGRKDLIECRSVGDAAAGKRVVEPRLVFHRDGRWYLAAWNVAKGEEHLFRLDRIVSVELGTRVFGEHQGPPLARYGKSLYFQSGAEREVTVRYRDTAAALAGERYGARAKANDDGSVSVTTKVTPGNFLHAWPVGRCAARGDRQAGRDDDRVPVRR
jgi:proteasome accessory factor C